MDVNKHVLVLATQPLFDMGFDRAVNGANFLFGESISLHAFFYKNEAQIWPKIRNKLTTSRDGTWNHKCKVYFS